VSHDCLPFNSTEKLETLLKDTYQTKNAIEMLTTSLPDFNSDVYLGLSNREIVLICLTTITGSFMVFSLFIYFFKFYKKKEKKFDIEAEMNDYVSSRDNEIHSSQETCRERF